jgi:hypothetical protein
VTVYQFKTLKISILKIKKMKKAVFLFLLSTASMVVLMVSCKKDDNGSGGSGNNCSGVNISVSATTTDATPCGTQGTVTVTASGSTGFTYSINGVSFQASQIFSAVPAGSYSVIAKDANGCTGSQSVTVGTVAMGPQFTQVRSLINSSCGTGCHLGGASSGGYNFDNNCSIVSAWSAINSACVSRNSMPPGSPLNSTQKGYITSWISGGHTYAN